MTLKLKTRTIFPAIVSANSPVTIVKTGLSYVFGFDITALRASLDPIYLVTTLTNIILSGATSGTVTVKAPSIAGANIITLPAATDTLVGKATTDTLTNKTLTSPILTTPDIGVASGTSLAATGSITSSGAAGIGYATGAGGTITQATSKATAVTLNKTTGLITMNAAALAAGTIVSFVLTNSAIAATDQIIVTHESGGTTGAYTVNGRATGAGAGAIDVRNNTAGSLSEAVVLRFSIIKSVSA